MLVWMIECDMQLRAPHTAPLTQGEDDSNFPEVKAEFRSEKADRINWKIDMEKEPQLDYQDAMIHVMIKAP